MITDKAGKNSALSQHAADQSSRLPRKRWENSRSAYVIVLPKRSRIEQGTCDGRIPGTKSSKCPPCGLHFQIASYKQCLKIYNLKSLNCPFHACLA